MATSSRPRRRAERAALDAALLDAAARAHESDVQIALMRGADVNATDGATGSTAVTCAIAGDSTWEDVDVSDASFMLQSRIEVLRTLVRSESISLYALNAPARGVTPLGLASWLNIPDLARVLLEETRGLVAVDGTDTLGVTPLMYAARDGAVEVGSILLANGARPDLRDTHHRTAIHHALNHPRLLRLCENTLRRQRLHEYLNGNRRQLQLLPQPHALYAQSYATSSVELSHWAAPSEAILSRSTASLIRAIVSGDVAAVYQTLFPANHRPAVLVNRLDAHGWSPLHYCVASPTPSVEILDALFLAGVDTSLYTTSKHGTPLHCLAQAVRDPATPTQAARLHAFVHHLVRELRAPLAATDDEGETCLHVAAEHGLSREVIHALLASDTRNVVREMRNARGMTALDVARPELRSAFGADVEPRRSSSVASFRTIRPSTSSSASTTSYASAMTIAVRPQPATTCREDSPIIEKVDASLLPRRILENLAMVGKEAPHADVVLLGDLREVLDDTSRLGELWIRSMQARIREAAQELRDARGRFNETDNLLETITQDLEGVFGSQFSERRDSLDRTRRRTTDSGDSDVTAVSSRASSSLSRKWRSMSDLRSSGESIRPSHPTPDLPYLTIAEEEEPSLVAEKAIGDKSFLNALLSPTATTLLQKSSKLPIDLVRTASPVPLKKDGSSSGTAKLKKWFRKKLRFDLPDVPCEKIVLPGERSSGHRRSPLSPGGSPPPAPDLLPTARQIVRTAGQDLSCIEGCMDEADQYLALASNLLSQTERRLKLIILNLQAAIESSRLAQLQDHLDDPFMSAIASTIRAAAPAPVPFPITHTRTGSDSDYSLSSASAGSSVASLSDTLIESEDDNTRTLRRLLTRKVEARTDGAFDEIDKALAWLRIVQDTLRTLRRRTQAYATATTGTPS